MNTLKFVQMNSLALLVQHELTKMILSGEIAMGEWLNEATLSKRFNVSRGPIREAFRSLEESGLLRQEKNRGVFVREISAEEANQIYEIREVLDEFIGRKAASSVTDAEIKALRNIVKTMDRAVKAADLSAYYAANLSFHDLLAEYARNPKLSATYRRLINELHIFRLRGLSKEAGMQQSNEEHHTIVTAIEAKDAAAAARACKAHVLASKRRIEKQR